jgi:hypothetical protein
MGDAYQEIHPGESYSQKHHDAQFRRLWGEVPLLTMDLSRSEQRSNSYISLCGHLLFVEWLLNGHLPWYRSIHLQLHAASYPCGFESYGQFINIHPGSYLWLLPRPRHAEHTCVCAVVVSQGFLYVMKCPPIGWNPVTSYPVEKVVQPWCAGVE